MGAARGRDVTLMGEEDMHLYLLPIIDRNSVLPGPQEISLMQCPPVHKVVTSNTASSIRFSGAI